MNKKNNKIKELKDKDFWVEYYSISDLYFSKYKEEYLYTTAPKGLVDTTSEMSFADCFKRQEEAFKLIELFRKQHFKENVKIIPYKSSIKSCKDYCKNFRIK
jgi:hypothetical protein